jgi:DNA-binding response OmpR family regulator
VGQYHFLRGIDEQPPKAGDVDSLDQAQSKPQPLTGTSADRSPSAEQVSRLLIIDDALTFSSLIGIIAKKAGFTPMSARSYRHACNLLQVWTFDCVTLDLALGRHTGTEVLTQLSKIGCRAPIIIISGSDKDDCEATARTGRSLGLNIYTPVPKPIDFKTLRDTLARIQAHSQIQRLASSPA